MSLHARLLNLSDAASRLLQILPRGKANDIGRDELLKRMRLTPAFEGEHADVYENFDERQLRHAKNELEKAGILLGPGGYIITDHQEACDVLAYWEKHLEAYTNKVGRIRKVVATLKPVLPQQPWTDTPLGKVAQEEMI